MVRNWNPIVVRVRSTAKRDSGELAAPVHSFAAALFLPQEKIHNFYDMCVHAQTNRLSPDADPRARSYAAPTGTIRIKHVLVRFQHHHLSSHARWVLTGDGVQKIASCFTTTASASATPKTLSTPTGSSPLSLLRDFHSQLKLTSPSTTGLQL